MTVLINIVGGMSLEGVFPALRVGEAYYGRVTASGGTPFYTYQIIKGALPAGLSLDPITGEVTGTPTSLNMFAITVRATDLQGMYVDRVFVIPGTNIEYGVIPFKAFRLFVTKTDGGDQGTPTHSFINLSLIALQSGEGGPNLCVGSGGTSDQSSYHSAALKAENAFNNPYINGAVNPNGYYWHSAKQDAPWWASFVFPEIVLVGVVTMVPTNTSGRWPVDFEIQKSDDGVNWSTVKSFVGVSGWQLDHPKSFAIL